MITHADYNSAYPIPAGGFIFGQMSIPSEPPPVGVGRVVRQDMDEEIGRATRKKRPSKTRVSVFKANCSIKRESRYKAAMIGKGRMTSQQIAACLSTTDKTGSPIAFSRDGVRSVLSRLVKDGLVRRYWVSARLVEFEWIA